MQRLGITPKYYTRICRFYQAYLLKEYAPKLDWQSVVIKSGYSDYQHLVKDLKQFSGVKPNLLIDQSFQNPESRRSVNPCFREV